MLIPPTTMDLQAADGDRFGRVLLVGTSGPTMLTLESLLVRTGYEIHATGCTAKAFDAVVAHHPDLVIVDAAVDADLGLCRRLKAARETRLLPIILATAPDQRAARIAGAGLGVETVMTLPIDPAEFAARVGASIRLRRYTCDLDSTAAIVAMLGGMIDAREGQVVLGGISQYARELVKARRVILLGQGINWMLHGIGYRLIPEQLTLEWLFGWSLRPLAWLMGVPWAEADEVGTLLGIKTVLNEFVGYVRMEEMVKAGQLSERSEAIATYALCGFSNFSSIAIQIGGIGGIAPERKGDLARLGLRAMVAGSLACFQTATIAGMLL